MEIVYWHAPAHRPLRIAHVLTDRPQLGLVSGPCVRVVCGRRGAIGNLFQQCHGSGPLSSLRLGCNHGWPLRSAHSGLRRTRQRFEDLLAWTECLHGPVPQQQQLIDGAQDTRTVRDDDHCMARGFLGLNRLYERCFAGFVEV